MPCPGRSSPAPWRMAKYSCSRLGSCGSTRVIRTPAPVLIRNPVLVHVPALVPVHAQVPVRVPVLVRNPLPAPIPVPNLNPDRDPVPVLNPALCLVPGPVPMVTEGPVLVRTTDGSRGMSVEVSVSRAAYPV